MSRLWRVAPLLVVGMVWGGFLMGDDKKEPIVVNVKMPTYYSRIGLSIKQKNEILKIRGRYASEIQELQQKIDDLKDKERAEYEKVLTGAQKARLKEMFGKRKGVNDEDEPVTVDKKNTAAAKEKNKDAKK